MGTKVLQMAEVSVRPEEITSQLAELLEGRNIAPTNMFEKYVVNTTRDGAALVIEVDDGSSYRFVVEKIS